MLGSKTFTSAIAQPATIVPGKSMTPGAAERSPSPAASKNSARASTRSSPIFLASMGASPENTAKLSTGIAASADLVAVDQPAAAVISGNTGGRLVIAARMLNETARMPADQQGAAGREAGGTRSAHGGTRCDVPRSPRGRRRSLGRDRAFRCVRSSARPGVSRWPAGTAARTA